MDMSIKSKMKILSVGTYLPEQKVYSDHLFEEFKSELNYNIPTNWLSERVGIKERRVGAMDARPSDHAIPAAQQALDNCPEVNPDLIDLVIFCGIERDQPEPATAHRVQDALGLNAKHAFDISNACYGFMQGMQVATHFISSGTTEYALVVTGEISTQVMRKVAKELRSGIDIKTARDKLGALTVGDAGGAVIIGRSHSYGSSGFDLFNTHVDSSHVEKCTYKENKDGTIDGRMMMGALSKLFVENHKSLAKETYSLLQWDKPDWVICHQMGEPPFRRIMNATGVSEDKMIKTFPLLGNITTATFAISYDILSRSTKTLSNSKVFGCFGGSGITIGQIGYTM